MRRSHSTPFSGGVSDLTLSVFGGVLALSLEIIMKNRISILLALLALLLCVSESSADGLISTVEKIKQDYCPIGSITAYIGVAPPQGWLICNGDTIDATTKTEYKALVDFLRNEKLVGSKMYQGDTPTKAILPNFQGYFLRGFDSSGNIDPNRKLGDKQHDGYKKHEHYISNNSNPQKEGTGAAGAAVTAGGPNAMLSIYRYGGQNTYVKPIDSDSFKAIPKDGIHETRPKNIAVNYLIKY